MRPKVQERDVSPPLQRADYSYVPFGGSGMVGWGGGGGMVVGAAWWVWGMGWGGNYSNPVDAITTYVPFNTLGIKFGI